MDMQKKVNARNNCCDSCPESQNERQNNDSSAVCPAEDVIFFDILTRLPATCLHRNARFVSKSWAAMICNSQFVEAHLHHAKPGIFLQRTRHPYGGRFLEFKDNEEVEVTDLNPHYPGKFLSSWDGLSLFYNYCTESLYVVNPVTMQVAKLPDVLRTWQTELPCAIARVPHTGEFKLFAAVVQEQFEVCTTDWYVLRLGIDNSWRKIGTKSGDFDYKCDPVYTGGYDLFWITVHRVIVMDVDKETFRTFQLPREHREQSHRQPQYLKMGDCLSSTVLLEQGYQIQILDPQSGNWTIYHQIGHLNYPTGSDDVIYEVFGAWMNQEVIFRTIMVSSSMALIFGYNVKTRKLRKIDVTEMGTFHFKLHTNSLESWKSVVS